MSVKRVLAFVVTATIMYAVGAFVYGQVVSPLIARFRGASA